MKIAVCMKLIPDLEQIRIKDRKAVLEGVPLKFGDMDLNALEAGVALKEAHEGEVVIVAAGPAKLKDAVKEALARGGDRAVIMNDAAFKGADSEAVAKVLAAAIDKQGGADMVICGEESTDHYSGQVPGRISGILGYAFASYVRKIEVKEGGVVVTRDMEEALEVAEASFPLVVGVTSEINEPRLASMVQILRAAKKPVEFFTPADLGLDPGEVGGTASRISVQSDLAPLLDRKGIRIEGASVEEKVDGLIDALKREGVI
ncbi:MAG: electron transfer flavoprotein subunit beta/FixA family protein [Planctomycetota bacterium]|jgi:electron transfer flavoprotein beta subunit